MSNSESNVLFPRNSHWHVSVPLFLRFGKPFQHLGSTQGNHFGTSGSFWLLGLAFRGLGASILTFWDIILAPRAHPGGAILALRDHPGGPWEQQDGFEVVVYTILHDLGMILEPVYISLWGSKSQNAVLF